MTLIDQITRVPIPYDTARGQDILLDLPALHGPARELLIGVCGCSPYLATLAKREAAWLEKALSGEPDETLHALLADVAGAAPAAQKTVFRVSKRRLALLAGLADLGGIWSLAEVTDALTRLADTTLEHGLQILVRAEAGRGKLPGVDPEANPSGGMVILAMGKMGAHELNYSSDIDLICLFDQDRFDRDDFADVRSGFVRITRRLMAMLSEQTGDGYVFRTDLRLRPDPSVTPVCIAMEAAERYYESVGRGWERAAHIKARPAAGDIAAGDAYLQRLSPFVWRKSLDFNAVTESEEMRQMIRVHKGLSGPFSVYGHNIKLGAGGIREIEFFTQTHQLIHGGRTVGLRQRGTVDALSALAKEGRLDQGTARALTALYQGHRRLEHGVQMINDAQTHDLPKDREGLKRLAFLFGEGDVDRFEQGISEAVRATSTATEPFFAPHRRRDADDLPDLDQATQDMLQRWRSYPALRSERARTIFQRLQPVLMDKMDQAARPTEALAQFDGFLAGLPAGVQLFSLFEANPQLIDLIVDICAISPALAKYLSRNAGVLDAVIAGPFFSPWPDRAELERDLAQALATSRDYEHLLDLARRWRKEWQFRVGVHFLRGLISATDAAAQYSDVAEALVKAVLPAVLEDFATRHGVIAGAQFGIVGMGSLGGRNLSAGSDLDLITVYDADRDADSDGARPLETVRYFARLTKAIVAALSAPMSEGIAYEVDMRLRPSGRQGPVATSLRSFDEYQEHEAWTWEHMALTRARFAAGTDTLGAEIEEIRSRVLSQPRDTPDVLRDVADMRRRLLTAKPGRGGFDVKSGPGRMVDVELLAQCGALLARRGTRMFHAQMDDAVTVGLVSGADAATLLDHYDLLCAVQQASRLLSDSILVAESIGEGGKRFLLRATGCATLGDLETRLAQGTSDATAIIDRVYPVAKEAF